MYNTQNDQKLESENVLFYTSATGIYLPFFPLYAYFGHHANQGAHFEFIVDDINATRRMYKEALTFLGEIGIGITFQSRGSYNGNLVMENSLRFLIEPTLKREFVYIGDVDILIAENVMQKHSAVFRAGLPYSNIIRSGTNKLTGLHFTRYDCFYPIREHDDLIARFFNDEELLFQLVNRAGYLKRQPEIDLAGVGRPQHGMHMSLNRIPFCDSAIRPDWGVTWEIVERMESPLTTSYFPRFIASLPYASRMYLANAYYVVKGMRGNGPGTFDSFSRQRTEETVFERIYRKNERRGTESLSGPSSTMARTRNLRKELPRLVTDYSIKSMLDAPCGDFHWMKSVVKFLEVNYIGVDVVEPLIKINRELYGEESTSFAVADIRVEALPSVDLIFCRDCLFHMSYSDISETFLNLIRTNSKYFMTTSHINKGFKNSDIKTGEWRWFDLFSHPFCFPKNFLECVSDGGGDRHMYMWRMGDIAPAMLSFTEKFGKSAS